MSGHSLITTSVTGFIHGTLEAGLKPQFGLMMDISMLLGLANKLQLTIVQWMSL